MRSYGILQLMPQINNVLFRPEKFRHLETANRAYEDNATNCGFISLDANNESCNLIYFHQRFKVKRAHLCQGQHKSAHLHQLKDEPLTDYSSESVEISLCKNGLPI